MSSQPLATTTTPDLPRSALDHLLEGCQVISPEYRYVYVNDAVINQGRKTREELIGSAMSECYPGIEQSLMFTKLKACMVSREPLTFENEFFFADGSRGWFELRMEPVPEGVAILSLDITARKRAQARLERTMKALKTLSRCNQILAHAEQERPFLRDVCAAIVDEGGYAFASLDVPVNETNDFFESAGVHSDEASATSGASLVLDLPGTGGRLTVHSEERRAFDEEERAFFDEIRTEIAYGVRTLRQKAHHEHLEEQLMASQRMEAVGCLAGGVAHDFNNLLSVVLSYSRLSLSEVPPESRLAADLKQITKAGEKAAALVRQLLAFSRKLELEPRVTNVNEIIRGMTKMLERLLGEHILVEVSLDPDLRNILVDPGQLEQVLMNLAVNARDAMQNGGRLFVESDNLSLDERYVTDHPTVEPGEYVCLTVSDTGSGMDADTRRHIFEPFFTTKDVDKGTGLGLSTVYGIVKQSGGNIEVYSEPGQGTCFRIYFPVMDAPASPTGPAEELPWTGGTETILLVEDEDSVRAAAQRILVDAGYKVLPAVDGREAMAIFAQEEARIDLILSDIVMPHLGGVELVERLLVARADLKVVFMSGYSERAHAQRPIPEGRRILGKPFTVSGLLRRVREEFDAGTDARETHDVDGEEPDPS